MKIIVTGSLGHVGKPLATELAQKGHTVTVISSKEEKRKEIEAIGATAAIGSLEDAGFLSATFADADAVFAMVPPSYTEPDQTAYYQRMGNHYVKALSGSGIKRVVHLSSYGAHLPEGNGLIQGSYYVESMLNELERIPITHLRPTYFYYNFNAFVDMIKQAGIIGSNYGGDDEIVMVAPADIATAAADELTSNTQGRKVRYVASDERTANEIAKVLGAAIGKPDLQWLTFSNEQVQESLLQRGMPAPFVAKLVELGAAIHSGKLREDYDLHPPVMGNIKLEEFAKEFAKDFLAKTWHTNAEAV